MVLGSNLHELFNDNNEEAKLLAFQLEALNNYLNANSVTTIGCHEWTASKIYFNCNN